MLGLLCSRVRRLAPLALVLAGCGRSTFIVQQYDGPPRPSNTVAILRVNSDTPPLVDLDGEPVRGSVEKDVRLHIEMVPGAHEVVVIEQSTDLHNMLRAKFVAAPGRVYRIVLQNAPQPGGFPSARVYEVDRGSDQTLAPAPEPLKEPQPAPMPPPAAKPPAAPTELPPATETIVADAGSDAAAD